MGAVLKNSFYLKRSYEWLPLEIAIYSLFFLYIFYRIYCDYTHILKTYFSRNYFERLFLLDWRAELRRLEN